MSLDKKLEGLWLWTPDMDEKVVKYGAGPSYFLTVTDPYGREIPMDEWMVMVEQARRSPGREVLISHV